jgi:hypothetical protein
MATQLGLNCSADRRNIGVEACTVKSGQKKGHIQVPLDWSLNLETDTFNKTYVNSKIQDGTFKVIGGAYAVTTETAEDTTQESTSGQLSVVRKALPIVTTTVKKGYEFHAGAFDMSADGIYAVLEIFETGVIAAAVSGDGLTISGFAVGMYEVATFVDNNGSESASTMIKYQLTDVAQYNKNRVFLTNLDFNPNTEINNIIDAKLTARAVVAGNKVYVKVNWARNLGFPILGFAAANMKLSINGVDNAIVGSIVYNSTTQEYAITPTATLVGANTVVVTLYDTTASINVAKVGTKFYTGYSNTAVAA